MTDLIDRNELLESFRKQGITDKGAIATVAIAPAVDAVPVVHRKWLHDESGANYCSGCMKYAYEDDEYHMIWHTQYCPHCGARMDGDENARV